MILVDTSVWIEFLKASPPVFPILKHELERLNVLAVECVFGELLQGARNQRERYVIRSYWEGLPKRGDSGLWIEAGILSSQHHFVSKGVGLIDAFLVAYARKHRALIWTTDKKLAAVLRPGELYAGPV